MNLGFSSCQAKRSAFFAAWVPERVLLDVDQRYVAFTVARRLRSLIESVSLDGIVSGSNEHRMVKLVRERDTD